MPYYEIVLRSEQRPLHEYGLLTEPQLPPAFGPDEYETRLLPPEEWRVRENQRYVDGDYHRPPWPTPILRDIQDRHPDHFLHVSVKDPTKVAYTPSEEYGKRDRQVTISPGRYLQKFFSDIVSADQIRDLASKLVDLDGVKFAQSEEDIERVYVNGPRSCMSGSADEFDSPFHPVRVYAAGDLAVAYLEDATGKITARALCWPDKKLYGRTYGDEWRLETALDNLGYCREHLLGARLRRVEAQGGMLVCPYIDDTRRVVDRGDYLVIADHGMCADSTSGLLGGIVCDCCGEWCSEDDAYSVRGDTWCASCSENTFWCEGTDDRYPDDDYGADVVGIGPVCQRYLDEHCFLCPIQERWFHNDDAVPMANGDTWSQRAFDVHGTVCDRTGDNIAAEDVVVLKDTNETVSREWAEDHAFEKGGDYYAEEQDDDELEEAA